MDSFNLCKFVLLISNSCIACLTKALWQHRKIQFNNSKNVLLCFHEKSKEIFNDEEDIYTVVSVFRVNTLDKKSFSNLQHLTFAASKDTSTGAWVMLIQCQRSSDWSQHILCLYHNQWQCSLKNLSMCLRYCLSSALFY